MNDQPQYIDLQVNGYAGVDFNREDLTEQDFGRACVRLREDGVAGVLVTIVTDELPRMEARLRRIRDLHRRDSIVRETVFGIHLEGPFLSNEPGYAGAHPMRSIRPADLDEMKRLLDAAGGLIRLVTLAPERDAGLKTVRFLAERGITVAAGHCNPSTKQLGAAIDAGLSAFTHLGNACPVLLHRHDNIIQRVLSLRDRLTICFIADGVHIPPFALGNYLRLAGFERTVAVTDAISAAGCGPGTYSVGEQTVRIGEDLIARSAEGSLFFGSTATMPRMAALLREQVGLTDDEIRRLLSDNPRRLLQRSSAGFSRADAAENCSNSPVGSRAGSANFKSSRTP
ncbi:MAG: N-acetylglucosamine-6-phosphate deacetylase [Pirellulales bacterium]|nr:N-acetylglucosamine-6-phosphate deacetylase [Pirellulales bacterium]